MERTSATKTTQRRLHAFTTTALAALASAMLAAPAHAQGSLLQSDALDYDEARGVLTMAPLLERVMPGVVSIRTVDEEFADASTLSGIGSGFVVDAARGHVLTNHHVIEDARTITVTLPDRRELTAELLGSDPDTDLALLRVPAGGLTQLDFGAGGEGVRVGDFVIAIGNPYGLSSTVTSGIVSATGREGDAAGGYSDFIQTDASINPGNSGGPLLNTAGQVVGVNASILTRSGGNSGIGFAVPTRVARNVVTRLARDGVVRRGRIGVMIQPVPAERITSLRLPDLRGAYVSEVIAGGAASRAGLRVGDVVVRVDGRALEDSSDLRHAVGLLELGERATLQWYRDGALMSGSIRVEASDAES